MKDTASIAAQNAARVEVKVEHMTDLHKEWRDDDLTWRKDWTTGALEWRKNSAVWIRWAIGLLLALAAATNIHIALK